MLQLSDGQACNLSFCSLYCQRLADFFGHTSGLLAIPITCEEGREMGEGGRKKGERAS